MKKYFCDVCRAEIASKPEFAPELGNKAAEVCGLEDLCSRCARLSLGLNVSALVLAELRRLAAEVDAPAEGAPPPAPPVSPASTPTGRGAKEKQAILAAINAFRQERGPGSVEALADMAGVIESDIWNMLSGKKVLMYTWRKVGKALNVPNLDTNEKVDRKGIKVT